MGSNIYFFKYYTIFTMFFCAFHLILLIFYHRCVVVEGRLQLPDHEVLVQVPGPAHQLGMSEWKGGAGAGW